MNNVEVDGQKVNLFDYENDGVMCYVKWCDVEPEEGKRQFVHFDRLISEAKAAGKKLGYSIMPADHSPAWLYETYPLDTYKKTRKRTGKEFTCYLPYKEENGVRVLDETVLGVWNKTVQAYAEYLTHHPDREWVSHIIMTGWPEANSLELQWHSSLELFDETIYVDFCKGVVDLWISAFEGKGIPLGIAYTDVWGKRPDGSIRRSLKVPDEIVTYALEKGFEKKVCVIPMGLWMAWPNVCTNSSNSLVKEMTRFKTEFPGTRVAFEGPMGTHTNPRYASLQQQLSFAVGFGAPFVQVWYHDIVCDENQQILKTYRSKIK